MLFDTSTSKAFSALDLSLSFNSTSQAPVSSYSVDSTKYFLNAPQKGHRLGASSPIYASPHILHTNTLTIIFFHHFNNLLYSLKYLIS